MIRVVVVDDHHLVRVGTCRLLEGTPGVEVVGQGSSGEEAVDLVARLEPDVVLMDVQMPGIGGLEATRRCLRAYPEVKILAVSIYEDEPYPSRLLTVGAAGYLTKRAHPEEMLRAIKRVVAGKRYISADIAQQLALRPFSDKATSPFEALSSREMQITLMVVMGHKSQEMSENLSLSPKTINSYRYRVFEKLNLQNDVELTRLAIKHGVIDADVA